MLKGRDNLVWGHSSAGRAVGSQSTGRRFDPGWLHHYDSKKSPSQWSADKQRHIFIHSIMQEKFCGAIAQLGERLVRNQQAAGSIPAGSTIFAVLRNAP